METEEKLTVLYKVAKTFNENDIVWAVGGSLLLYFNNLVENFDDLDIMVMEEDAENAKDILNNLGEQTHSPSKPQYKTTHFYEFTVDGVDIDLMGGFTIIKDDIEVDCSLSPETITEHHIINDVDIPLHSLEEWRKYYYLMGRREKEKIIGQRKRRI